ncbi:MAG: aminopeptidase P family protein [Verrucomicrobia bacterium]|nr:aminopeptidase P family protein [Verrucomicrobiota bacterium]
MKSVEMPKELFELNRDRLKRLMLKDSVAVVNSNDVYPTNADGVMAFHQNADMYYLTGINQEESILLLAPDAYDEGKREILFLRKPSEHLSTWEGDKLSKDEAKRISGVENVEWLSEFDTVFHQLMCEAENVYLNSNEHQRAASEVITRDIVFVRECMRKYPLHCYRRLARLMHELRAVKSDHEIKLIRKACEITARGFRRVLEFVKPGINEAEVEAEYAHEFIRDHANFAYLPIIAAGKNNCVLHYNSNERTCEDGDLLLMDVGAAYGYYNSDMTRTIPVNGRFTRRQKELYCAVLDVLKEMTGRMTPGKTIRDLREETDEVIAEKCVELGLLKRTQVRRLKSNKAPLRKYFMHGVSHPIGLDVHDAMYNHQKIEPGWLLTCEPGIYIRDEGVGVRLENTVLITEEGTVNLMSDIPIEPEEIEDIMNR